MVDFSAERGRLSLVISLKSTTFALALFLAALPNGGCSGRVETASAVIQDSISAVHGELSQAGLAACDHYYAAQYARCDGPTLPASENARVLARFEQVCENEAALPGSGVTAASLEACASALDASPCELPEGPPVACNFSGSLPGGSVCTDGLQCQSGACSGTVSYSPGGPTAPFTCGTCAPAAVVGQACNSAGCQATAVCITADTSAAQPNYACVAVEQGAVGAACDGISSICKPGLYCSEQTRTCEKLAVLGAPCGDLGDPGGCVAPLGCGPSSTCVSGHSGAPCVDDTECAPGLGCVPVGSASRECSPITWAGPGESCTDAVRCLVGSWCDSGTCPTVVPDGQSCTVASTCDTFAECFQGTCTLLDAVICR
jgi:hypothetical protein